MSDNKDFEGNGVPEEDRWVEFDLSELNIGGEIPPSPVEPPAASPASSVPEEDTMQEPVEEPTRRLSPSRRPGRGEVVLRSNQLDETPEDHGLENRDYRPVRFRRDGRLGCLGGLMYAVFIISVSIILACLGWMAASDVLALNKDPITTTIELPRSIFSDKEVDVLDEDGKVIGTETVSAADIDYVASTLKDAGIIEYKFLFKLFAKFSNADEKVDPGTYELSTNFDYRALVKKMQAGSESQIQTLITFPEGYNMRQIFAKLEDEGICSAEDLYQAAETYNYTYSFLDSVTATGPERLEGFLFPDTYYFYEGMQASSAINKFLSNMHYLITADMLMQTENLGLTWNQVIIIASLIEKETSGSAEDRANIASVIYNRLAADMPLQIDASVLYDHPEHEGAPTAEMLATDSEHNTHTRTGLPPTAISNPGLASIQAALQPAETGYYYYALDESTGEHRFFTNYNDHQAFVATQSYAP